MQASYRKAREGEEAEVCSLVARVFNTFVAPEFEELGVKTFLDFNTLSHLQERLDQGGLLLVAEERGIMVGVIELCRGNHICRFFVEGAHQRQGVGRGLLQLAIRLIREADPEVIDMTVNSSPNSVTAYETLGFTRTGEERTTDGIRHVPMVLDLRARSGR